MEKHKRISCESSSVKKENFYTSFLNEKEY